MIRIRTATLEALVPIDQLDFSPDVSVTVWWVVGDSGKPTTRYVWCPRVSGISRISGMFCLVLGGHLADVVTATAVIGDVSQREPPLGLGEIAQHFLRRPIAL